MINTNDDMAYRREIYEHQLTRKSEQEKVNALLAIAFHDPDWQWCQAIFLQYAAHPQASVRGIAILCFGHLARIHHRLEMDKVIPVIKEALNDTDFFVRGHAESALEDLQLYL